MAKFTKIPADTFKQLQINAGVILSDFTPATGAFEPENQLGATTGGITFAATPTFSDYGEDVDNFPKIIESGVKLVMSLIDGLIKSIPQLTETAPKLIIGIVQGILDNLPEIIMSGPKIIMALIEGLISAIPDLVQAVPTLIKSIVDTFLNYDWGSIGSNIVSGIKNGILNTWNGLKTGVGKAVNGLVSGVESILEISSPSKVFARIGGYMAEGLGQGFDREMTGVQKDIEDQMTFGTTSFSVSGAAKSSVGVVNGLLANNQPNPLTQVNLVVDGQTLARVLFDPLRGEILQRGVSLA